MLYAQVVCITCCHGVRFTHQGCTHGHGLAVMHCTLVWTDRLHALCFNSWIVFISRNVQKNQQRKQSKTAFFKSNTSVQGHPLWTSLSLLPATEWFNRWGNNVHQIICQIMELLRYYSLREWQVKRVQLSARQAFYSGGFHMINRHLAISMPTKNT